MLSIYLTSQTREPDRQTDNRTNGETIHHQKLFNVWNI